MTRRQWIILSVFVVLVIVFLSTINWTSRSYGVQFNSERQQLGVPMLQATWKTDSDSVIWYNPDMSVPRHSLKELDIRKGKLEIERDDFEVNLNGRKVTVIGYYHYPERCYNLWLDKMDGYAAKPITCQTANELLRSNGLLELKKCKPCENLK